MGEVEQRKIRKDNKRLSACGRTSLARCIRKTAGFVECKGCTLVYHRSSIWTVINGKLCKKCSRCGKFLPVNKYHNCTKHLKTGPKQSIVPMCKMCISEIRYERIKATE